MRRQSSEDRLRRVDHLKDLQARQWLRRVSNRLANLVRRGALEGWSVTTRGTCLAPNPIRKGRRHCGIGEGNANHTRGVVRFRHSRWEPAAVGGWIVSGPEICAICLIRHLGGPVNSGKAALDFVNSLEGK